MILERVTCMNSWMAAISTKPTRERLPYELQFWVLGDGTYDMDVANSKTGERVTYSFNHAAQT